MLPILLLAVIRLALSVLGAAAAIARGVDATVALVTWGVGAAFCAFAVITTRQGMYGGSHPSGGSALRLALRATYPSTIGLSALIVFSLVLRPQLAALMAGLLAGLGFAALAVALATWLQAADSRARARARRRPSA